ncbi:excalibur calcium-binding domain-containing protein [Martelella lutilitoris]|uniref:Excalibur calcium-binding domain-containing protein n=1 Tax=Martelella lutilitoris TaxID=2583532 RepID=A0A5C4JUK7_9HYPH|nr:excalibur calcium-binding domain-containing protein [Martelella lutilitoris]
MAFAATPISVASGTPVPMTPAVLPTISQAAGWTCSQASSCAEAVRQWCNGYSRADGDSDVIPCENVCRSLAEVRRIRSQIGC